MAVNNVHALGAIFSSARAMSCETGGVDTSSVDIIPDAGSVKSVKAPTTGGVAVYIDVDKSRTVAHVDTGQGSSDGGIRRISSTS